MPRRRITLYGSEPMLRWGRTFDELERRFKMGASVGSAVENLLTGVNCGKPGVHNNHVLPVAFAKRYFAAFPVIYGRPADSSGPWEEMRRDAVKCRQSYYTVQCPEGIDEITLERLFKRIEDNIASWLCPKGITPDNRGAAEYWMAWFIAMQYLRTPLTAKVARHKATRELRNLPDVSYVVGNLLKGSCLARTIFSLHWEPRLLGTYSGTDELLLGEHCVHQSERAGKQSGLMFTISHNVVLICSPDVSTYCLPIHAVSFEEEQFMVRGLNRVTIQSNEEFGGYVYRGSSPAAESIGTASTPNSKP